MTEGTSQGSSEWGSLARRAQAGDAQAFAELFERLHRPILNYVYHILGDGQAAEDVTQEAFIRAHQNLHQLGPPWDFKSWLYRIAGNLARDHLRRGKRFADVDLEVEEGVAMMDPPTTRRPAERHAARAEQRDEVWRALEAIPTQYRQALVLRELHALSYQEVAQALEVSYDNARQIVHRARLRFRDVFGLRTAMAQAATRCREMEDLLSAYHDGELDAEGRRAVEAHMAGCAECRRTEEDLKKVGMALAALPLFVPSRAWAAQVLEEVARLGPPGGGKPLQALRQRPGAPQVAEGNAAAPAPQAGQMPAGEAGASRLASLRGWLTPMALAGAAGALVLGAAGAWYLGRGRLFLTITEPPATANPAAAMPASPGELPATTSAPGMAAATSSATPTPTPVITSTPTPTATLGPPQVTADENLNCRAGPGKVYDVTGYLLAGQTAPVDGKNAQATWWWIERQDGPGHCYVWQGGVTESGDFSAVPVVPDPPTPMPPDTQPPQVTVSHAPAGTSRPNEQDLVTFTATASDDRDVARIEIWVQPPLTKLPSLVKTCTGVAQCVYQGGPYRPGSLTYFARAWDAADNQGESPPETIRIYSFVK